MATKSQAANKSLTKNAVINVIYKILDVIFPLISASYISRVLAPEGVGKVAYVQNIVSYFVMFAALGIPGYGTREIAQNRDDPDAVNKLFSELFVINALSTAVCAAGYYAVIFCGASRDPIIYMVCGTEILFNFMNIDWLYQGEEKYAYITLRSIAVKLLSVLSLFIFVKDRQDYVVYALIICLGIGCNNVINIFYARNKVRPVFRNLELKRHLGPIFTLMLSAVTASLYSKVDITMLGWLHSDEIVGYYTNAHKVVNVGLTVVTAMSAVFMPRLSYIYKHEKQRFQQLITAGVQVVLLLAIPCCIGMILVADDLILAVFGPLFAPAVLPTQIMAILIVVIGAGDLLCYQVVISSGNEKALIKSRVFASMANILLNAALIPRFQHTGAAIASVISELIVNGILLKSSLSIVRVKITRQFCGSMFASTAVMSIAVILTQKMIDDMLLSLATSVSVGAIIYFAAALAMKNETMEYLVSAIKNRKSKQIT